MAKKVKSRNGAFGVHFSASVFVFLIFLYFVFIWWYPNPYLTLEGGWFIVGIIVFVDVILGPTLTFVVFKPGKKGLVFDLVLIIGMQICALIYGISVIYTERPQFLAFAVDRFVIVSKSDVDQDKFRYPAFLQDIRRGPLPVFAKMPIDPNEKARLLKEVMEGNPDLEFRPEYYEPIGQFLSDILASSKDINDYRLVNMEYQQKIDKFIGKNCGLQDACAYFPVIGKERSMVLALMRGNGNIVGAIDIDPWVSVKTFQRTTKGK